MPDKWDKLLGTAESKGVANLDREQKFAFDKLTREHSSRGQQARDLRDGKK